MPSLQPLPLGVSDWAQIRKDHLFLVDKTALLGDLVQNLRKVFISRPYGIGKTMLLSMLADLFAHGNKNFEGMAIYDLWPEQRIYTVIKLDFSKIEGNNTAYCESSVQSLITKAYCAADLTQVLEFEQELSTFERFLQKVESISRDHELVFLIDDWDSALLEHLDQPEAYADIKQVLTKVYRWLRRLTNVRFLMVTGIMSFNDLAGATGVDINDISRNEEWSDLLGITPEELEQDYAPYLSTAAQRLNFSTAQLTQWLQNQYGGYCFDYRVYRSIFDDFAPTPGQMYCPLALNKFFVTIVSESSQDIPQFRSYWMEASNAYQALPYYLRSIKLDLDSDYPQLQANKVYLTERQQINSIERDDIKLLPLMLQTGYLTIKEACSDLQTGAHRLTLGYPNRDVAQQVLPLVDEYIDRHISSAGITRTSKMLLIQSLFTNQFDVACYALNQLLDGHYIDYSAFAVPREGFYLTILQHWLQDHLTCTVDRSRGMIEIKTPNCQVIIIAIDIIPRRDYKRYFDLEPQYTAHTLLKLIIAADEQRVVAWRATNPNWIVKLREGKASADNPQ